MKRRHPPADPHPVADRPDPGRPTLRPQAVADAHLRAPDWCGAPRPIGSINHPTPAAFLANLISGLNYAIDKETEAATETGRGPSYLAELAARQLPELRRVYDVVHAADLHWPHQLP